MGGVVVVEATPPSPALDSRDRRHNPIRGDLEIALRRAVDPWSSIRRAFDVVFALLTLTFGAPLFAVLVLAVRCSSRGPVFYAQPRVGRRGRAFHCWKFRTMVRDADQRLATLLGGDPELAQEFAAAHKLRRDPRITKVGRFLRRTSLDELPQFFNVLRGEMSVVGPRPIVWDEAVHYGPLLPGVLTVRPGLTGLWQVSGRNKLSYEARVALQAQSARPASLRRDVGIVVRTALLMLPWRDSGAC